MAAPSVGAVGTAVTGTGTSVAVPVPTGVVAGSLVVVVLFTQNATTINGFGTTGLQHAPNSPQNSRVAGGGTFNLNVLYKIATGPDSGTYTLTQSASDFHEGAACRIDNANTTTPWDVTTSAGSTASGTVSPAVSLTTTQATELLFHAAGNFNGGTWTPSTGFTQDFGTGSPNQIVFFGDMAQAAAGGTGSVTATCSSAAEMCAWLGAVAPASGTTAPVQGPSVFWHPRKPPWSRFAPMHPAVQIAIFDQTVTPTGITSNEQLGSPTVSTTYTINASGIVSNEQIGTSTVAQAISANGIISAERLGTPAVTTTYTVTASGIVTAETLGNANTTTATSVTPSGIGSAEQLGSPSIATTYTINANGIVSNEQVSNNLVARSIGANGIVSNEQLGQPALTVIVAINGAGVVSSEQLGAATVTTTYTINASGIVSGQQFGGSNVASVSQINASGIATSEAVGRAVAVPGSVTITTAGIVSEQTLGRAQISIGLLSQVITASAILSLEQFGAPFVGAPMPVDIVGKVNFTTVVVSYVDPLVSAKAGVDINVDAFADKEAIGTIGTVIIDATP